MMVSKGKTQMKFPEAVTEYTYENGGKKKIKKKRKDNEGDKKSYLGIWLVRKGGTARDSLFLGKEDKLEQHRANGAHHNTAQHTQASHIGRNHWLVRTKGEIQLYKNSRATWRLPGGYAEHARELPVFVNVLPHSHTSQWFVLRSSMWGS